MEQVFAKLKHWKELLVQLGEDVIAFSKLEKYEQVIKGIGFVEKLLNDPETEFYYNATLQLREPGIVVLNRGLGDYPIENHIATFESNTLYEFNSFISSYTLREEQLEAFDQSINGTKISNPDGTFTVTPGPNIGKPDLNPQSESQDEL